MYDIEMNLKDRLNVEMWNRELGYLLWAFDNLNLIGRFKFYTEINLKIWLILW